MWRAHWWMPLASRRGPLVPTLGATKELLPSKCVCVCVCRVKMMECVFQMTARGMSHLLDVASTPPPGLSVCSCKGKVWAQKLSVFTVRVCACVCACVCVHLYSPDQAIPAAINAHVLNVQAVIPRALSTSSYHNNPPPPPAALSTPTKGLWASVSHPPIRRP